MAHRLRLFTLAIALAAAIAPRAAHAVPTIRLYSSRSAVLADGRDSTQITAEVRDTTGRLAPDGTSVTFTTSLGAFQRGSTSLTVGTQAGSARALLSSPSQGTATVAAASTGGGFQRIEVLFTNDPGETFEGNSYVVVTGDSALIYAAGERAIEAVGKPRARPDHDIPGAHLQFRNIDVRADTIQVDCASNVVRAQGNVLLKRGGRKLRCMRLYYPLIAPVGFAVADVGGHWRPVELTGNQLTVKVRTEPVPAAMLDMATLAEARQLVSARRILLFPGNKLQFTRPRFFQDRQPLMSLPYYSLGLFSNQMFADQLISVGTQGIGVNLPLYYDMSPTSTGVVRLRNGERYGTAASATRPGLALDVTQSYTALGARARYTGDASLTDINRADWGFRFSHSQEFSSDSRGTLSLETPQHRSLYAAANLQQQFAGLNTGVNAYGNRSLRGIASSGGQVDGYLETVSRQVGRVGYRYAVGATGSSAHSSASGVDSTVASQGVHLRMYSAPLHVSRSTSLTHTWSLGQAWGGHGRTGSSVLSTISASQGLGTAGSAQLNYDYTQQPSTYSEVGRHRVSSNLYLNAGTKSSLYLYGSALLDAPYRSLTSDATYNFARRWRVGVSANFQSMSSSSYRDIEFSLARSIGLRDISFTYSTLSHRFYLDLQGARF